MRTTVGAALACAVLAAWGVAFEARAAAPLAAGRVASCSWDRPGHNPFMGDVVASLDRYRDLPADVRDRLQRRMAARDYDDLVTIRRDAIEGKHFYEPRISEMHFGEGRICNDVTRERWTEAMEERGLVYCDSGHCILVPTVCRNVSRIARRPTAVAPAVAEADEEPQPTGGDPLSGPTFAQALGDEVPPLVPMDPAAAGGTPADGWGGLPPPFGGWPVLPVPPGGGGDGPGPGPWPGPGPGPGPGPSPIPEPGTWLMMAAGLAVLARRTQRRAGVPRCATQKR